MAMVAVRRAVSNIKRRGFLSSPGSRARLQNKVLGCIAWRRICCRLHQVGVCRVTCCAKLYCCIAALQMDGARICPFGIGSEEIGVVNWQEASSQAILPPAGSVPLCAHGALAAGAAARAQARGAALQGRRHGVEVGVGVREHREGQAAAVLRDARRQRHRRRSATAHCSASPGCSSAPLPPFESRFLPPRACLHGSAMLGRHRQKQLL